MNIKDSQDSQALENFHLGLSLVEHSQLEDLLHHVASTEEKSPFIDMKIINGLLEKLKILGIQEGAKSDDFFFNNGNPY